MKKSFKYIGIALSYIVVSGVGYVIGKLNQPKPILSGNLRIDNSNPKINEGNGLFLELYVPVSEIKKQKIVHVKVINDNYGNRN